MATDAAGFSAKPSLCRTFDPCRKTADGCPGAAWTECDPKRGYLHHAKFDAFAWLDKPGDIGRCRSRTCRTWPFGPNTAWRTSRLQLVRPDPVSARLRPEQVGCSAWELSTKRLHGAKRGSRNAAHGEPPGTLATRPKNANRCPATGRHTRKTSRHGTEHS